MTYGQRVIAILVVFLTLGFAASGVLVHISTQWASDDMKVGKGYSKFPPQLITASPRGARQ
jgi:hypothetical protein